MKKQTLIWLVILGAGVVLFLAGSFLGNKSPDTAVSVPKDTLFPSVRVSPAASVETGHDSSFSGNRIEPIPPARGPATCRLRGNIEFLSPDLYRSDDAFISYKNIDHEARIIDWTITPNDDVLIGPNLFAGLSIPDGERFVSIVFDKKPKFKQYALTAEVTYSIRVNGALENRRASCDGSVKVTADF